jgi:hypothetical protein
MVTRTYGEGRCLPHGGQKTESETGKGQRQDTVLKEMPPSTVQTPSNSLFKF